MFYSVPKHFPNKKFVQSQFDYWSITNSNHNFSTGSKSVFFHNIAHDRGISILYSYVLLKTKKPRENVSTTINFNSNYHLNQEKWLKVNLFMNRRHFQESIASGLEIEQTSRTVLCKPRNYRPRYVFISVPMFIACSRLVKTY
jgi:hypothetical protein